MDFFLPKSPAFSAVRLLVVCFVVVSLFFYPAQKLQQRKAAKVRNAVNLPVLQHARVYVRVYSISLWTSTNYRYVREVCLKTWAELCGLQSRKKVQTRIFVFGLCGRKSTNKIQIWIFFGFCFQMTAKVVQKSVKNPNLDFLPHSNRDESPSKQRQT